MSKEAIYFDESAREVYSEVYGGGGGTAFDLVLSIKYDGDTSEWAINVVSGSWENFITKANSFQPTNVVVFELYDYMGENDVVMQHNMLALNVMPNEESAWGVITLYGQISGSAPIYPMSGTEFNIEYNAELSNIEETLVVSITGYNKN